MKIGKIIFLLIVCISLVGCKNKEIEQFRLEDKYYNVSYLSEISIDDFNKLLDDEENFGLFIYQDFCAASDSFEKVLNEYIKEYPMGFYKLSYNDMKETELKGDIKFYPSFVIYKNGKLIDFLDADSASDADYYKSVSGFNDWFTKYVIMS